MHVEHSCRLVDLAGLHRCTAVRSLDVSCNRLTVLGGLAGFPVLQTLVASDNSIAAFPDPLPTALLRELWLNGNRWAREQCMPSDPPCASTLANLRLRRTSHIYAKYRMPSSCSRNSAAQPPAAWRTVSLEYISHCTRDTCADYLALLIEQFGASLMRHRPSLRQASGATRTSLVAASGGAALARQ